MSVIKEEKLLDILQNLKNNYHAIAIKAEFEDEGASLEEVSILRKFAKEIGLDFTLKIGGCGALNDIQQAKNLAVNTIVAPMIESPYALKKFVQAVEKIYYNGQMPELFVNIETISGYKNFDEILSSSEAESITGIVVGRFDLAKSINLGCKDIHSEEISNIVSELSLKSQKYSKVFVVGGGVNEKSLSFFKTLDNLAKFETRKIVFSAKDFLNIADVRGVLEAMNFELAWLKYKQQYLNTNSTINASRINSLTSRYEAILSSAELYV